MGSKLKGGARFRIRSMEAVKFLLVSLYVLGCCSLGCAQTPNLTVFQISPCNGTREDSVSRFKSDIYAVRADLSNCSIVTGPEDYRIVSRQETTT